MSRFTKRTAERQRALWCHFGALWEALLDTLGSLLYDLGYMRVALESLRSNFEKQSFSKSIFMILCIYGVNLTSLWKQFSSK